MYRSYNLEDGIFVMDTVFEDEFGELNLRCSASLDISDIGPKVQVALECSGSVPVSSRISELQHFLSLFSLFDPQFNTKRDGIQKIVSQTPPWTENA